MAAPKLRFKEFDGNWKSDKVGKFLIEYKQKVPSSTDIEIYSSSRNGLKPQKEYFDNRELQNFGEYGVVPPNYLTYRHMSDDTTFKFNINLIGKKIAVSKEYPVFTTNEFMDSSFLLFKLNESNDFKKFAIEQKKGGTRTRLYFKALCTWETLLPTKEEQTKIASFLSKVDEKISQLTQKHQLLSQYKQGMMQKLFSQQIRFKADDGSEFKEWENSYIGNECKITTGNKDTQNKVDDGLYPFFVRSQTVEKINSYSMDCEAILTSGDGVGVGKNYHYINGKFDFHQRVYCLYEFSERLIGKYLYIYFSNHFYDRVKRLSAKNSVDSVRMDMISKMEIKLPCREEQTKIANFLSAIDQKIEVVAQQIKQAKQWKKGLLQQMFV